MTDKVRFTRSEGRVIAGVCSFLSKKYNYPCWIVRTVFVLTFLTLSFPLLIYLFLWLILPNTITKENKLKKYLAQTLGFFIGGFMGLFVSLGVGALSAFEGDPSTEFLVFILVFMLIPFGVAFGFFTARLLFEHN